MFRAWWQDSDENSYSISRFKLEESSGQADRLRPTPSSEAVELRDDIAGQLYDKISQQLHKDITAQLARHSRETRSRRWWIWTLWWILSLTIYLLSSVAISLLLVPRVDCATHLLGLSKLCPENMKQSGPALTQYPLLSLRPHTVIPDSSTTVPSETSLFESASSQNTSVVIQELKNVGDIRHGAKVLPQFCYIHSHRAMQSLFDWVFPQNMASLANAGQVFNDTDSSQCWSFSSRYAQLAVRLAECVNLSTITLRHSGVDSRALRDVAVWGMVDGAQHLATLARHPEVRDLSYNNMPLIEPKKTGPHSFIPLALFTYDISKGGTQSFAVLDEVKALNIEIGVILFQFLNNWGATSTDVCGIKVFGGGGSTN